MECLGDKMKRILYGKEFNLTDLSLSGYNGLIFDLISAIEFMHLAISEGALILGGDIIIKNEDGEYIVGYDNWSSDSKNPQETFICALEYLKDYLTKNPLVNWRVSVVSSNISELLASSND